MNDFLQAAASVLPIPAKYIPLIALALPYVTKVCYGIIKGHGLRGIWRSIWYGSANATPAAPAPDNKPLTAPTAPGK